MNDFSNALLFGHLGRAIAEILAGFLCYLGFRLYVLGVFDKAQEVTVSLGPAYVALKRVAAGAIFVALGVAIALTAVLSPITVKTETEPTTPTTVGIPVSQPCATPSVRPQQDGSHRVKAKHNATNAKSYARSPAQKSNNQHPLESKANSEIGNAAQSQTRQRTATSTSQLPVDSPSRSSGNSAAAPNTPAVAPNAPVAVPTPK